MTDDRELFLTRSEEQLVVRTETRPIKRVRVEKFIVTEERTITVMVRREEVRLIELDLPESDAGTTIPLVRRTPLPEMFLREERPVVTMELVPTARVWLDLSVVTGELEVDESVRSEQIDLTRS